MLDRYDFENRPTPEQLAFQADALTGDYWETPRRPLSAALAQKLLGLVVNTILASKKSKGLVAAILDIPSPKAE